MEQDVRGAKEERFKFMGLFWSFFLARMFYAGVLFSLSSDILEAR